MEFGFNYLHFLWSMAPLLHTCLVSFSVTTLPSFLWPTSRSFTFHFIIHAFFHVSHWMIWEVPVMNNSLRFLMWVIIFHHYLWGTCSLWLCSCKSQVNVIQKKNLYQQLTCVNEHYLSLAQYPRPQNDINEKLVWHWYTLAWWLLFNCLRLSHGCLLIVLLCLK